LDGVDNHKLGFFGLDMIEDGFEGIFTEDQEIVVVFPQAFCTHLQLVGTLFTADVENALIREAEHCLQ